MPSRLRVHKFRACSTGTYGLINFHLTSNTRRATSFWEDLHGHNRLLFLLEKTGALSDSVIHPV